MRVCLADRRPGKIPCPRVVACRPKPDSGVVLRIRPGRLDIIAPQAGLIAKALVPYDRPGRWNIPAEATRPGETSKSPGAPVSSFCAEPAGCAGAGHLPVEAELLIFRSSAADGDQGPNAESGVTNTVLRPLLFPGCALPSSGPIPEDEHVFRPACRNSGSHRRMSRGEPSSRCQEISHQSFSDLAELHENDGKLRSCPATSCWAALDLFNQGPAELPAHEQSSRAHRTEVRDRSEALGLCDA